MPSQYDMSPGVYSGHENTLMAILQNPMLAEMVVSRFYFSLIV